MRIGHFIRDLDGQGGIETYVDRLGRGLTARGDDVFYLGFQGQARSNDRICVDNVEGLYDRAQALSLDILHLHTAVSRRPPDDLVVLRTVHDHGATCPSGSRHLKRTQEPCNRIASLPACLIGHYVDGCGSRRPHKVKKGFERLADNQHVLSEIHTITVSQYLKNQMIALGYEGSEIEVLHSPAPDGPTSPPPLKTDPPPRVLFLGRLVPEKGVDWLLRTVPRLDPQVHIDIAGEGYHHSALEEQAADLGVKNRVSFHGWKEGPQLHALFKAARVVVLPSVWHEPAGLVTLEAAAMGRPVVASSVGGIPEYADPSFSVLVPPNHDERLAEALTQLCRDPEKARVMGQEGHSYVRSHHTMSQFLDRQERLYKAVISDSLPAFSLSSSPAPKEEA